MGFVFDFITDWLLVGFMERLRQRNPVLAWSLILIPLALLAGLLVWALLR
jgi:hypothetical protein